ncbi:right-handed parallel beta-helix repeat-containing protein [Paenibacillus sp. CC-CFT747]|nr:right-handed parallel beta-helix repeat-containing protein [Paenibacillus sp. CC-CFT747]
MRLVFFNETSPAKNMQLTLKFGSIPHHNTVEYNELFNGHRGGITLGGSYNVLQHNVIRDNGKGSGRFLDGKPIFPDSTRYAVNQEDSYGDNCVIRHNLMYGSNHGILAGCYSLHVENNHIYNMDSVGINLYSLRFAVLKGNVIYNCGTTLGLMNSNFADAYVEITGNSLTGGNLSFFGNSTYQVHVTDNHLTDIPNLNMGASELTVFRGNRIRYSSLVTAPVITINKLEGCVLDSSVPRDITLKTYRVLASTFNNVRVNLQTVNGMAASEKIYMEFCTFLDSAVNNHIFGTKSREVTIVRSSFTDTVLKAGNINTPGSQAVTIVVDSELTSNKLTALIETDFNQPGGTIRLTRSTVLLNNSSFAYLVDHTKPGVRSVFTLFLKDSTIRYTGSAPLSVAYYDTANPMIRVISVNTGLDNVILLPPPPPSMWTMIQKRLTRPPFRLRRTGRLSPPLSFIT